MLPAFEAQYVAARLLHVLAGGFGVAGVEFTAPNDKNEGP